MTQKYRFLKSAGFGLMLCAIVLSVSSCIDQLYNLGNGVSMDMELGGDSLAIPIGSTDTIRLGDNLPADLLAQLKLLEDGGYAFTIKNSLDPITLDKIDESELTMGEVGDKIETTIDFGNIRLDTFKISGISVNSSVDLGLKAYTLGALTIPPISSNSTAVADMSGSALSSTTIPNINVTANQTDILSGIVLPPDPGFNVVVPIADQDPVPINTDCDINYAVTVPSGVTNISDIELKENAVFEVTIQLSGAKDILTTGELIPEFTIDPSDLFKFTTPLSGKVITFSTGDKLTMANEYKVTKTLPISMINLSGDPVNSKLQIIKNITAKGNMSLKDASVNSNKSNQVGTMDMLVSVAVKNVEIKSMEFDIPDLIVNMPADSTSLDIDKSLPDQIQKLNTVFLNNDASITINLSTENLPEMSPSKIKIEDLSISFPKEFIFEPMAGLSTNNILTISENFNPAIGKTILLKIKELNMKEVPVNDGILSWKGKIKYFGQLSFGGHMNSLNIPNSGNNAKMNVQISSSISFKSAEVTTNKIAVNVPEVSIPIPIPITLKAVKHLGVIKMKPNTTISVNIKKPDLPLVLAGEGLQITFPSIFAFNPPLVNNKLIYNSAIPESINLVLDALNINQDLVDGELKLNEPVIVSGGVALLSGVVNSADIESLAGKKLEITASTSDLGIQSTSLQLNDLSYPYKDTSEINVSNAVPDMLVALDSLFFRDGATLQLSIDVANLPDFGSPLNVNLVLDFPKMFEFQPGYVNEKNQLTINQPLVDGKLSKIVGLRGLLMDGKNLNGNLTIHEVLRYAAEVSVNSPVVNSDELIGKKITLGIEYKLANVKFKSIYGKLNPVIPPINQIISIKDKINIPENVDITLDITKPVIAIYTESNVGIPIKADIDVTPIVDGSPLSSAAQAFSLNIPKSPSALDFRKTTFWISPDSAGMPTGSQFIETQVQKLLTKLPDEIRLVGPIGADVTQQHFVDLDAAYQFNLDYEVTIPFAFGKDLYIGIKQGMPIDNPKIGEMAKIVGGIAVLGTIENSIPLELELTVIPYDADSIPLDIEPIKQIISAGAHDGSGVKTNLMLMFNDTNKVLGDLRGFNLEFKASSNETVAGTPIKPENFVKADLKVRVDGGINIGELTNK